ncbi:MAG: tetratricopeptide repeat protein [Parachlamydiales bacterium]|jgi:hypothetical protein
MNKLKSLFLFLFLLLASACYKVPSQIEPKLSYNCKVQELKNFSHTFPPLSGSEKNSDWGKEYTIALAFAKKLDLYRAISTFERADILVPPELSSRKEAIEYYILLCYYLAQKYDPLLEYFRQSELSHVDKSFLAFEDLLIILYESYLQTQEMAEAQKVQKVIEENFPETAQKLKLSAALIDADFKTLNRLKQEKSFAFLSPFLENYELKKKSVNKAKLFNALLPGAGYLYLGQNKSALTALLLNSLFIAAAYEFFHKGYTAAGIITVSFEAGWYFGGINGAGEEAKYYNEQLYQKEAAALMQKERLFPFFNLKYTF